jgi:alpha-tubulin suppressor-like RCC1 family protein
MKNFFFFTVLIFTFYFFIQKINCWKSVCAGNSFSLGTTDYDALYSWGNNEFGSLGPKKLIFFF